MANWLSPNPFRENPSSHPEIEELRGKPPRKYTREDASAVVRYYADTLSMRELRKRQDITNQQIAMAVEQKNEEALENQQMMEAKKAFG